MCSKRLRRIGLTLFCLSAVVFGGIAQPVSHPSLNSSATAANGLKLTLTGRWQNYNPREESTHAGAIKSPKSVHIHPDGSKVYVNSLEGCNTVVFDAKTKAQLANIEHNFSGGEGDLWTHPSGFYKFRHYKSGNRNLDKFMGKPVESAFSHGGRYLWVPYYRRSYDINAQDPSALAVIDTKTDKIVRIMEAGVLPKMIAVSPDSRRVAIAHWGDNTVGYIDISSDDPGKWRHLKPFVVDQQIFWNLSLTNSVNRDSGSGNALRGTAFTPDGRYLLVACMSGNGGIGVIDTKTEKYLGKLYGTMANTRHILFSHGYLYMSVNNSGYVTRISEANLLKAIDALRAKGSSYTIPGGELQRVKVGQGARTIVASPDGRYIFAACNFNNSVDVVDTRSWQKILSMSVDSYPVGMDISADGKTLYVTMQARKDKYTSGNCVDIIRVSYPEQ